MKRIHTIQEWLCPPDTTLLECYVLYDGDFYEVSATIAVGDSSPVKYIGLVHKYDFVYLPDKGRVCIISGELESPNHQTITCEIEFMPKSVVYSSFGIDSGKYQWYDNFCFTKIKCITIHNRV